MPGLGPNQQCGVPCPERCQGVPHSPRGWFPALGPEHPQQAGMGHPCVSGQSRETTSGCCQTAGPHLPLSGLTGAAYRRGPAVVAGDIPVPAGTPTVGGGGAWAQSEVTKGTQRSWQPAMINERAVTKPPPRPPQNSSPDPRACHATGVACLPGDRHPVSHTQSLGRASTPSPMQTSSQELWVGGGGPLPILQAGRGPGGRGSSQDRVRAGQDPPP